MSLQFCRNELMLARAPALLSKLSCHVLASPLFFSCSICSKSLGRVSVHSFLIRLKCLRTRPPPTVMNAPISIQPMLVFCMAKFTFELWDALRNNSSPMLYPSFGLRLGTPNGH
ncbi:hypothetical protein BpHYR1_031149 [Brachionus plicatilis]|uniref:Uncharacterized protein n=1 Tax=Brachionus plicatilis TaxID=10195 RepID=A0A3M7SDN0_BRAPC|nr:hypothetical protein BpHYR1_031149 [Brachionus plicatilis]